MKLGNKDRLSAATRVHRFLSFGGGVQSSTLLLMALHGELPRPDAAIFSDPGWETAATYAWIDEISKLCQEHNLPFYKVSKGDIRVGAIRSKSGKRFATMPFHTKSLAGEHSMLRRQCTKEFKIEPLTAKQRELMGVAPKQRVPSLVHAEVWIGISLDEIQRVSEPRGIAWQTNWFPLIERRMSRHDCLHWLQQNGYPRPPKSACIGCPFKDNARWRELKLTSPEEFQQAVEFDREIRHGMRGVKCEAYLHRSLIPLAEVDFSNAEDHGQLGFDGLINECEGMCGL